MNTPHTHLSLLRKYHGRIFDATGAELKAAQASIPRGMNALGALFQAHREYDLEQKRKRYKAVMLLQLFRRAAAIMRSA